MSRPRSLLARLLWGSEYPELLGLCGSILWGLWVLAPWWSALRQQPPYQALLVLPEWAWGLIFLLIGGAHAWFWQHGYLRARRVMCLGCAALWAGVWVVIVGTDWQALTTVLYPLIFVSEGVGYLGLRYRARCAGHG